VQICLEGQSDYWSLREKLFEHQQELTQEKILELGASGAMGRDALEKCVADPQTDAKLQTDVAWAHAYGATGTPLVLLNGKETWPSPPFIFGMAMSGGDVDNAWFKALPPPR
jgi:serine/threonine-protein kinase